MRLAARILYGSQLFGTATPESDFDYREILLPTPQEALGLKELRTKERKGKNTETVELPWITFVRLALKANPSCLDLLWVGNEHLEKTSPAWERMRKSRYGFLSKEIYFRFRGYAIHEMKEMATKVADNGAKRNKEIEEHGYCLKKAIQTIRLLKTAGFFLLESVGDPFNNFRAELAGYRKNPLSLVAVTETINFYLRELDEAFAASKLPDKPTGENVELIEEIMIEEILK